MSQHCSEDTTKNESKIPMYIWVLMAIVTIIVAAVSVGCLYYGKPLNCLEALIAWFTALAFTGMIGTLFLQREELALQRKELQETRTVLKDTSDANRKSAEIALKQMQLSKVITEIETAIKIARMTRSFSSPYNKDDQPIRQIETLLETIKTIKLDESDNA